MQKSTRAIVSAVALVAFAGSARGAEERRAISLFGGGSAAPKAEIQTLQKNCRAVREWYEIEGGADTAAATKINSWIRKQLTVGKKLDVVYCPSADSAETYELLNRLTVTGEWQHHLGVQIGIHFPGGSGRHVMSCQVFDERSGKHVDLKSLFTTKGKAELAKLVAQDIQKAAKDATTEWTPETAVAAMNEGNICLTDTGVSVITFGGSGRFVFTETVVAAAAVKPYLKPEVSLAKDAPR